MDRERPDGVEFTIDTVKMSIEIEFGPCNGQVPVLTLEERKRFPKFNDLKKPPPKPAFDITDKKLAKLQRHLSQ